MVVLKSGDPGLFMHVLVDQLPGSVGMLHLLLSCSFLPFSFFFFIHLHIFLFFSFSFSGLAGTNGVQGIGGGGGAGGRGGKGGRGGRGGPAPTTTDSQGRTVTTGPPGRDGRPGKDGLPGFFSSIFFLFIHPSLFLPPLLSSPYSIFDFLFFFSSRCGWAKRSCWA